MAVLGLYNSGKTFLLNQLTGLSLPSSKRVATRGVSFVHTLLGGESTRSFLDSEGAHPILYPNP